VGRSAATVRHRPPAQAGLQRQLSRGLAHSSPAHAPCGLSPCTCARFRRPDTSAGDHLAPALAASAAFLALSAIPALATARVVSPSQRPAVGLTVGLRDLAVAATLATQAFGTSAATVAGIYGVLMLITDALTTTTLRRGAPRTQTLGEPADDHL
jgi:hypothetical protein